MIVWRSMNTINIRLNAKINDLTREFVTQARDQGIEVHGVNIEWENGTFVADVQYLPHEERISVDDDCGPQFLETA